VNPNAPDFEAVRAQLAQARATRDAAQAAAKRAATANAPNARVLHDAAQRASDAAAAAGLQFAAFTDPRENVARLSDRSPFALLPVRVETRFVTIPHGEFPTSELWVRIYPDDCSIDTFEPDLSASELANAQRYWNAIWRAGGVEDDERAAWRGLVAAHGSGRAGYIVDTYRPVNLADKPAAPNDGTAVPIVFPPDPPAAKQSWSQAPRVAQLADRFVVLGYNGGVKTMEALGGPVLLPLYVGPDPSVDPKTDPTKAIHPDGPDLFVPDELAWLVDFDRAVAAGMGLRIELSAQQASAGFDRVLVLGLQLSASDGDGKAALEALLAHHRDGRSGLALIPQGTPAHNSTGAGTGYTRLDDPDQSFEDRKRAPLFAHEPDATRRRDGEWIAQALGVDPALFARVHGADGADQMQARAMQRALWPATIGYWMDKLLAPVFDDRTVDDTRAFFTSYVSGRGALPALRIGRQPYGVLPATAFSRIGWLTPKPGAVTFAASGDTFLARLFTLLRTVGADWAQLANGVSHVGKPGDAHQILLDVVGLHPDSVEYHARYAETLAELFNTMNLSGLGGWFLALIVAAALEVPATDLLKRLGYTGATEPDIVNQLFLKDARQIANVVDDVPLSETAPVRPYTDDGRNYLRWLADAAQSSLDALVQEHGFSAGKTPETLLYLYLRHALMTGYYDASYGLHRTAGFLSAAELQAMKPEPPFVHVADAPASESRFAALYKTEPRITSQPQTLVADYITANLAVLLETRGLHDQLDALAVLENAPTASLERAFAEHVDCCTYRYDAWLLGFVNLQLDRMRTAQASEGVPARTGVYLGAYAWLEDLRPSKTHLTAAQVPPDLAGAFEGDTPLLSDPANGGYVHAPSLTHAKTAAVLRSGYLANATPANPDTMSVNLSSDRVRTALAILEGIRNGQSLGALLGYQFERGLHDDHGLAEVDKFVYPLRKAFPLAADAIGTTATPPGVPIEAIEARNVMDALKLIEHIRATGSGTYPFGVAALPPAAGAEASAIAAEVNRMLDAYDAIADLALAEGVHQAVQGNFERIAATLDAYTTGHFPPEPEVVQTPPSGIALTHRVAVQFTPGLPAPAGATPRATAEPALDAWLATRLPPLSEIACTVRWTDPVTAAPRARTVTLADLAVRPLDVLDLVKPDDVQAMNELDDRVLRFVVATDVPRPDAVLQIEYMTAPLGTLNVFEATALIRTLKTIVAHARPLRATDAMLHGDAAPENDDDVFVDRARVAGPKAALDALQADAAAFAAALAPLVADPVANRAALVAGIDATLDGAVALLERAARFNLPQSGWGFAYAWKQAAFADLIAAVRDLVARWDAKLADFDARVAAYDALPGGTSDDARFVALRGAEVLVTTTIPPLAATPAAMRAALDGLRTAFAARRDQFAALANAPATSFAATLASAQAIPTADLDVQPLDLRALEDRAVVAAQDAAAQIAGHASALATRSAAVQAQIDAHDAAATATARAQALDAAAKALLGSDFRLCPEFAPAHGAEWANAYAASAGGALTQYLTATANVDFPVDEWLYGVARVRPAMRAWEQAVLLAGALGVAEPALTPVQFPFAANDAWAALEYPPDYVLDSDRLLYTAQYAAPFDATQRQCGLLLDEWTEVVPSSTRDTGITFDFDRPDNEPPQAILLVTPATASGTWHWDDLVGALNETLDLAKVRAVEPSQIDGTAYARFLPATVLAVTTYGINISTALAAANGVFRSSEVIARA
jgi:hypothetical protein